MSIETMRDDLREEDVEEADSTSTDGKNQQDSDSLFEKEDAVAASGKSKSISKTIINFWLDGALGVVFLASLWTSFVTRFVFPPATAAEGWTLWGLTYNQWSDTTFALLCTLGGGIVVHVMLHWSWVCGVITGRLLPRKGGEKRRHWTDGEQTLVGVGLIVLILNVLGVAFAYAMLTVQSP